ncbi:hypothetical protein GQ42DRAFT_164610 [Ramicandelaber brevisporus]|nr:hypothetical protein GQ42DRAFT_164610 [Ramicandelaber brevisporus]
MASRLDRLLGLLETGSSNIVRHAAAAQLGEIQRQKPTELFNLLSRLLPLLKSQSWAVRAAAGKALQSIAAHVPEWNPDKIVSEDDTDSNSNNSNNGMISGLMDPQQLAAFLTLEQFDPAAVASRGRILLAASNDQVNGSADLQSAPVTLFGEHISDPVERLALQKRLIAYQFGLMDRETFLTMTGPLPDHLNSELQRRQSQQLTLLDNNSNNNEDDDYGDGDLDDMLVPVAGGISRSSTAMSIGGADAVDGTDGVDTKNLSARERAMLKRKARRGAGSSSASSGAAAGSSSGNVPGSKVRVVEAGSSAIAQRQCKTETTTHQSSANSFVEQPGQPNRIMMESSTTSSVTFHTAEGRWPFAELSDILSLSLIDSTWEVRHGAGIGLREVLRSHGSGAGRLSHPPRLIAGESSQSANDKLHAMWLDDMAVRLLCVFVLDRFIDCSSDHVVAPVRETCAQALGAAAHWMTPTSVLRLVGCLLHLLHVDLSNVSARTIAHSVDGHSTGRGGEGRGRGRGRGRGGSGGGGSRKASTSANASTLGALQLTGSAASWQIRNAAYMALKYVAAARTDVAAQLLSPIAVPVNNVTIVEYDMVNVILDGLNDFDDDVRNSSASTLQPLLSSMIQFKIDVMPRVMNALWKCIAPSRGGNGDGVDDDTMLLDDDDDDNDGHSDLATSSATIMHIISEMMSRCEIQNMLKMPGTSKLSLSQMAAALLPFFRHASASVRAAALRTMSAIVRLPSDDSQEIFSIISLDVLRMIFQNVLVELNEDIRNQSADLWKQCIERLGPYCIISYPALAWWFSLCSTPVSPSTPLESSYFFNPHQSSAKQNGHGRSATRYALDEPVIRNELSLVPRVDIERGRLCSFQCMGFLMHHWPQSHETHSREIIFGYWLDRQLKSLWANERRAAAYIVDEWAQLRRAGNDADIQLVKKLTDFFKLEFGDNKSGEEYVRYSDVVFAEDMTLLGQVKQSLELPLNEMMNILPMDLLNATQFSQIYNAINSHFTPDVATDILEKHVPVMLEQLQAHIQLETINALSDAFTRIGPSARQLSKQHQTTSVLIGASLASALTALGELPDKLGLLTKAVMEALKTIDNVDVQFRAARTMSRICMLASMPTSGGGKSREKVTAMIINNLCILACSDPDATPLWSEVRSIKTERAMCLPADDLRGDAGSSKSKISKRRGSTNTLNGGNGINVGDVEMDDATATAASAGLDGIGDLTVSAADSARIEEDRATVAIQIRGSTHALETIVSDFGSKLGDIGSLWTRLCVPVTNLLNGKTRDEISALLDATDTSADKNAIKPQDLIDVLHVISVITPKLDASLHDRIVDLLPAMVNGLGCEHAVVRHVCAKALSVLAGVLTAPVMMLVVKQILVMLGDQSVLAHRLGAVECITLVANILGERILPYVALIVVPLLARMSDTDDSVRLLATNTFATLIKLVPLESGSTDPSDFPAELIQQRQSDRQFISQLLDPRHIEEFKIPIKINATLRPYQQDGVNWLWFLNRFHLHGALCDDMGLGKSLQTLVIMASDHFLRAQRFEASKGTALDSRPLPSLIVCPATLVGHWGNEISQFVSEHLKPLLYAGNANQRRALRDAFDANSHSVVVASYDVVRNDISFFGEIAWNYCVLDEGHIIKNSETALARAIRSLKTAHRLILSGTPIQNNVLELWSLFDFLMPGYLGSERVFNARYGRAIANAKKIMGVGLSLTSSTSSSSQQSSSSSTGDSATGALSDAAAREIAEGEAALAALHRQVLPFLLRRLKEDVLKDLPPKIIQDYYCEMSELQRELYDEAIQSSVADDVKRELTGDSNKLAQSMSEANPSAAPTSNTGQHVFQIIRYLQRLVDHPELAVPRTHPSHAKVQAALTKTRRASGHTVSHSGKLTMLHQLLLDCGIGVPPTNAAGGGGSAVAKSSGAGAVDDVIGAGPLVGEHRVLIFCQLREMIDVIQNELLAPLMPTVSFLRLDGSVPPLQRHALVQRFNSDPTIDILLLTTSVGGLGLNLTGADTVIFVDHDWNPQNDLQAMDRAHRIGQKKVVNVYRLITRGTIEEKIMGLQRFKTHMANTVISQQNAALNSMNTDEIIDLFSSSSVASQLEQKKSGAAASGGSSQQQEQKQQKAKQIMSSVVELWDESQYNEEYNLDSFVNSLTKK